MWIVLVERTLLTSPVVDHYLNPSSLLHTSSTVSAQTLFTSTPPALLSFRLSHCHTITPQPRGEKEGSHMLFLVRCLEPARRLHVCFCAATMFFPLEIKCIKETYSDLPAASAVVTHQICPGLKQQAFFTNDILTF